MNESFDKYVKYLKQNKYRFPSKVYDFAIAPYRYDIDNPHSLHDTWMISLNIKENRNNVRPFNPKPTIELILLGQQHDRDIILTYENVYFYDIKGSRNSFNWGDTFHGDISHHEVRIHGDDKIIHEIQFVSESTISIICSNFSCTEQMHT